MSKTENSITKFKLFLDLDKEINYINEMNKKGWKLVYIKGGCFYTFVKTQPDEYFTVLYCDKKENISKITTFAAQCGYESIPHTVDGLGDMLYLTGKKGEVSEEFVSDTSSRIECYKKIFKKLSLFTVIIAVCTLLLVLETAVCISSIIMLPEDTIFYFHSATFYGIISIFYIPITTIMIHICCKYKKKINLLKSELIIYE